MFRLALRNLRAHAARSILTALAIVLGGAMLGGTIIYGESAQAAYFDDLARGAAGIDVSAVPSGTPELNGAAAVAALAALPGVAHAETRLTARVGLLDRRGRVISNGSEPGLAISVPSWSGFGVTRTVEGRLPDSAGEAALDVPTAQRHGFAIGDTVRVLDAQREERTLRLVGLIDLGSAPGFADSSVLALRPSDVESLIAVPAASAASSAGSSPESAPRVKVDREIVVDAEPGVDEEALRARVIDALGPGYGVRTGTELRTELAARASKYIEGFLATLAATSLVAIAVAGLVVYNTFQILVAQRVREYALLRCLGARRGQLVRLVVLESGIVGVLAALCGTGLALAAGQALLLGQEYLGRGLPDYRLAISAPALIAPAVTGLVVTVVCALIPALTAGRVSPLEALREATHQLPTRGRWVRRTLVLLVGGLLGAAGLVLANAGRGHGFDGLTRMVGGAMVAFIALVVVLPLLITALTAPLRWLLARVFGVVGRLAMDNAGRHPVRLAATVSALMIGIAPLTTFAVILATARAESANELAENFPVDFVVSHVDDTAGRQPIPDTLVERLRATPELGAVTRTVVASTPADGCCAPVAATEPGSLGVRVMPEVVAGELGGLPPGTVAVQRTFALNHQLDVGDPLTLGPSGNSWDATLVAIYDDSPIPGEVLVNWTDFEAHLTGDVYLLIARAPGTTAAQAGAALDTVLADDPVAVVASTAARHDSLASSLDRRLTQFDVLLGISMVIALLGIANALALAVVERRQESGILRALGLTRRQLYRTLLVESVLICVVGAALGIAFGLAFGWVCARELILSYGHGTPSIPVSSIALYVGLAVTAGVLASIIPARSALRPLPPPH